MSKASFASSSSAAAASEATSLEPHRFLPAAKLPRKTSPLEMSQLSFSSFHPDESPDPLALERPSSSHIITEEVASVNDDDAEDLLGIGSMEFNDSHTSFVMEEGVPLPQANGGEARHADDDASGGVSSASTSTRGSDDFSNSADRRRAQRKQRQLQVGQPETMALRRIRVLLFFVTLFVVVIGAIGMFMITQQNDINSFEQSFSSQGSMILQHVQARLLQQMEALDTLSTDITKYVVDQPKAIWPEVTLPHSASVLERYLQLMNVAILTLYPIVSVGAREQWEQYSVEAQGWIDDALQTSRLSIEHKNRDQQQNRRNAVNVSDIFQNLFSSPSPTVSPTKSTEPPSAHGSTAGVPTKSPTQGNAVPTPSSFDFLDAAPVESDWTAIIPYIHDDGRELENKTGPWAVWWQYAPVVSNRSIINYDIASSRLSNTVAIAYEQMAVMSPVHSYQERKRAYQNESFSTERFVDDILIEQSASYISGDPYGYLFYPVFNDIPVADSNITTTVALLSATFLWKSYFQDFLSEENGGIICVVNNTVKEVFTLQIDGGNVTFLGYEDLHDTSYDYLAISTNFSSDGGLSSFTNEEGYTGVPLDTDHIFFTIYLFPSDAMKENYSSSTPTIVALSVVLFFALAGIIFCVYDYLVSRRQKKVMENAMKTHEIVSSLFPETVRDRIMQDAVERVEDRSELNRSVKTLGFDVSSAIADFYPAVSVLFSDITGFTAWCSEREPSQVFLLLESIYSEYDAIAKKRKVFKVETIGDCYMAVAGLPEPRADHALLMCRFARECLNKLQILLSELEVTLGPGTADLSMRFGIHSGPVTAGVLRSQNARFQLFGDTVNTAARMESNGAPGMVHISQETANELTARGKSNWFYPRSEKITAKGKGELQTYWLDLSAASMDDRMSVSTGSMRSSIAPTSATNDRRLVRYIGGRPVELADIQTSRLVDWIVDTLSPMLSRIMTQRKIIQGQQDLSTTTHSVLQSFSPNIMEDVLSMEYPTFVPLTPEAGLVHEPLDAPIKEQLHDYVHWMAALYSQHPRSYHNLEHTAHVIMSVIKCLHRMIPSTDAPDLAPGELRSLLWDPVTPCAAVLAALVRDVEVAAFREASLETAWAVLIQSDFSVLRGALLGTDDDTVGRFQYLWARLVLADGSAPQGSALRLLEYVMQVSETSHRMQHWHTYQKWTERRWQECVASGGCSGASFYQEELQYMEEQVLPLIEQLHQAWDPVRGRQQHSFEDMHRAACKVRDEWRDRGRSILAECGGTRVMV